MIEPAAALAERVVDEAPQAHILASSREALRVEGEHVHLLYPLEGPPDDVGLTAAEALKYSAVRLFMERAAARGNRSELCDADAPIVGDRAVGVELTTSAAPLFVGLSLLDECRTWCEQALAVLDDASRGTRREMILQEALALSSMFTKGNGDKVRTSIGRALALAETFEDRDHQLQLLAGLNIFLTRTGDFSGALTRDIIDERLPMQVVKIAEHYGNFIVTANIAGNFDKRGLPDPLALAFYFSAYRDQIVQLIILRNQFDI